MGPEFRIDIVAKTGNGHIATPPAYEPLKLLNYWSGRQHLRFYMIIFGSEFIVDGVVETRHGCIMTSWATKVGLLSTHHMVKCWGRRDHKRAHNDSLGHTQLLHRPGGCQHTGISDQSDQTWLCPCTNRWAYTNRLAGTNQLVDITDPVVYAWT